MRSCVKVVKMEDLCSLEVVKISRSQNNVAHELAHLL